ncbi:MAG: hypothetical protein DRJ40_06040 [Thermoprotei archaeon]|nr:MAG: hypothetical protein DRJ40_06040 [Thermoprotei archaeon]
MSQEIYDVIIVGAGLSGCYLGKLVAEKGFNVLIIERLSRERIGDKVCGDGIGLHHFKRLGIPEPTGPELCMKITKSRVYAPDEKSFIDVEGEGFTVNRLYLGQRFLREAEKAGAKLLDQHQAYAPIIEGDQVVGVKVLDLRTGSRREFRCRVLVDASGVIPAIRLKLPREWWVAEVPHREDYCIAYREIRELDVEVDDPSTIRIYLSSVIAPGGYWWFFPKGKNVANIGLGLQWKRGAPNPLHQFRKYIEPRFPGRVVHGGGGIVPTRRPIWSFVWNGFVAIGDAACTANPIHGGGIGPSLLSAYYAAEAIEKALVERPSVDVLWILNVRYMKDYGAKQASLDLLRKFLQKLSDEELNFLIKSGVVTGAEVYGMSSTGTLTVTLVSRIISIVRALRKPSLLLKLKVLADYMSKVRELYLRFPLSPREFPKWKSEVEHILLQAHHDLELETGTTPLS